MIIDGWPPARRVAEDTKLLADALDVLERAGCQFWACDGPTLRPVHMITCAACSTVARLRYRLDLPIKQGIEGQTPLAEERYRRDMARATAGPSPDGATTLIFN
jgi:hypothetical protein